VSNFFAPRPSSRRVDKFSPLCSQSNTGPAPSARFCELPCQKANLDEGRELINSEALADVANGNWKVRETKPHDYARSLGESGLSHSAPHHRRHSVLSESSQDAVRRLVDFLDISASGKGFAEESDNLAAPLGFDDGKHLRLRIVEHLHGGFDVHF
jgi:hypothetical protein